MDKEKILQLVINELDQRYQEVSRSAYEAKNAATHEEAKAENKYDTRGLEASYLAGAQAKRAVELKQKKERLTQALESLSQDHKVVGFYSLVELCDGENQRYFFLLPDVGGVKVICDQIEIITLSLSSPMGKLMLGKEVGDFFDFKLKNQLVEYELKNCF